MAERDRGKGRRALRFSGSVWGSEARAGSREGGA